MPPRTTRTATSTTSHTTKEDPEASTSKSTNNLGDRDSTAPEAADAARNGAGPGKKRKKLPAYVTALRIHSLCPDLEAKPLV